MTTLAVHFSSLIICQARMALGKVVRPFQGWPACRAYKGCALRFRVNFRESMDAPCSHGCMSRDSDGLPRNHCQGPPCSTLLRPAGRQPLKQPYGRFRNGPAAGSVACCRLLSPWTPHTVRLCLQPHTVILNLLFLGSIQIIEIHFIVYFIGRNDALWVAIPGLSIWRSRDGHP
jgi:hypothetical protein